MKKSVLMSVLCVMAVVLFSGCSQNIYIDGQKTDHGRLIDRPQPPARTMRVVEISRPQHDVLKLFVMGEGATDAERQLAGKLVSQAKGGVAPERADVRLDKKSADIVLNIRPHLTTVDHDGNYWRLNCEVLAEMQTRNAERVVASQSFKYVMDKRVLGLEAALAPFAEKGGKDVAAWCSKNLASLFGQEVGIALLAIELPQVPNGQNRNALDDNRDIVSIGEKLNGMAGLLNYELTGREVEKGVCTYRLVYLRKNFKSGIDTHVSVVLNKPAMHK